MNKKIFLCLSLLAPAFLNAGGIISALYSKLSKSQKLIAFEATQKSNKNVITYELTEKYYRHLKAQNSTSQFR